MDVTTREEYQLRLTKREFTLITKALTGHLSDDVVDADHTDQPEVEEARELGLKLMGRAATRADDKSEQARRAYQQAEGNGA